MMAEEPSGIKQGLTVMPASPCSCERLSARRWAIRIKRLIGPLLASPPACSLGGCGKSRGGERLETDSASKGRSNYPPIRPSSAGHAELRPCCTARHCSS